MSSFSQLDSRQTRRLMLAGAVALPKPFPCKALVRLELGGLTRACGEPPDDEWFVVIRERGDSGRMITRYVRASDVVAIYVPPEPEPKSGQAAAEQPPADSGNQEAAARPKTAENCDCSVDDLDCGRWVMQPEITSRGVKNRLNVDLTDPKSCVQAIVFVPKHAPVYTVTELAQTAAAIPGPKPKKRAMFCSSCN